MDELEQMEKVAVTLDAVHSSAHYGRLARYIEGIASSNDRDLVDGHLGLCVFCRNAVASLQRARSRRAH